MQGSIKWHYGRTGSGGLRQLRRHGALQPACRHLPVLPDEGLGRLQGRLGRSGGVGVGLVRLELLVVGELEEKKQKWVI